jgi:hypothetical protein
VAAGFPLERPAETELSGGSDDHHTLAHDGPILAGKTHEN